MSDKISIAILGFGVVGSGVAEVLTQNGDLIEKRIGKKIEIKYILDLRDFPDSPFGKLVIHDFNIILNDPEISIVAEMMGGSHPAFDFSAAALRAGKSVVTSNKEVVSNFGTELLELAKQNNVNYLFEASVGGGIPVIRPMQNDLCPNDIISIDGILNGTTNYILTKMTDEGEKFEDVLLDAQKKGYAEANPSADIDGIDAARKIVILSALAFGKLISPQKIHTEGIRNISSDATEAANLLGYKIKLIGHAEKINGKILACVTPRLVRKDNPIAGVDGVFNGILVSADMVGKVMFYGPGAGKLPTASAVSSDIMDIAVKRSACAKWSDATDADIANFGDFESANMMLFTEKDIKLAEEAFKKEAVKVRDAVFALITDKLSENEIEKTLASKKLSPTVRIRIL